MSCSQYELDNNILTYTKPIEVKEQPHKKNKVITGAERDENSKLHHKEAPEVIKVKERHQALNTCCEQNQT